MSIDWNGKPHWWRLLGMPCPRDRIFWIVTEEGEVHEVAYSDDYKLYTGRETYCRVDGEPGSWEPDEIAGWTDSHKDADEAAAMLVRLLDGFAEA
jgi:hypothetical protein